MKKTIIFAMALAVSTSAFAQIKEPADSTKATAESASVAATEQKADKKEKKKLVIPGVELHGFVRTYLPFDTRESVAGTEDFFYYLPKDVRIGDDGTDLNAQPQFRYAALTSRLWVEAKYKINDLSIGGRIEMDFYAGLSGNTGTAQMRLRQAFVAFGQSIWDMKVGQAWHPMAADMPDIFDLNTGAPFGPFSRTPQITFNLNFTPNWGITASALWQMQYTSQGPMWDAATKTYKSVASADFIKYGCTPEVYLGVNYKNDHFLVRLAADLVSIAPRHERNYVEGGEVKTVDVKERITTISPFFYFQYKYDLFALKFKTIYAQAGEQVGLNGGYAVTADSEVDGYWRYTPTRSSSSWISLSYGKKLQGILFGGYVKNFGTAEAVMDAQHLYFYKNSFYNMNQMFRVTPAAIYSLGKLQFGLEYECTGVEYGEMSSFNTENALCQGGLHWVINHRIQGLVKFTF